MSTLRVLSPDAVPIADLEGRLSRTLRGEVRFSKGDRALYATDGSNYRQVPIGVVLPRDVEDVLSTLAICREYGAPVLSRGGGTSLCGQSCNIAVIMDFSKYLHHVLEIDEDERWTRVEPGTILDELRKQAKKHGITFGPDPATHDHCTLGGMLGNNSCGVHSQMAGRTVDNTESLEIVTYDGLRLTAGWMTDEDLLRESRGGGRRAQIFARIRDLRDRYARLIRERYPKIPRRVSGYNLDELLPAKDGRFNLGRALVGSEGTLITILEAKLKLVPWPAKRSLLVLGYKDIFSAADHLMQILPAQPMGLEAIDELLVKNLRKKHLQEKSLKLLPEGNGWLLVEFGGETKEESDDKARQLMAKLGRNSDAPSMKLYDDEHEEHEVWLARESGLGATAFVPGEPVTWEGWEDSAVPPEKMGPYLRDLCDLYKKYNYIGSMYGHFGQGCLHTRITFDLQSTPGIRNFRSFLDEATTLVTSYGGSISGEHGDGQSKAEFLYKMFGPELITAFEEFKGIWDPDNKMNPHKVVRPYKVDENLRYGADYAPWRPKTYFQFPDDNGGLADATQRCVGVGKCRRMDTGDETMCPSFLVTREEKHSTRGRAHLLWELMQGAPLERDWQSEPVKEALDLCLACKGCKGDCPVNVDVATFKAEFLAHYHDKKLRPRHAYAFGFIDQWARLASLWPGMVNLFTQTPLLREAAKLAAGMPVERSIPAFAPRTFQSQFRKRAGRPRNLAKDRGKVLLWPDTFNNHFFPETAMSAAAVLEAAGFEVEVPQQHVCCGRPLYDFGFLPQAKRYLQRVMQQFRAQIMAGIPIVVLEPSCASVFRDELHNLFPKDELAERLRKQVMLLSELLQKHAPDFEPPQLHRRAVVHGHCHHKSLMKFEAEDKLLQSMGLDLEKPNSGCCGMAGSFGFERDKYEVSQAIGERVLLPAVRQSEEDTFILTDGFSCREQIAQGTRRHALHIADALALAMEHGPRGPQAGPPERELIQRRRREERRGRMVAAGALAAFAGGLLAFGLWHKRR